VTPDAQALAPVLARLNRQNDTEELHPEDYLDDAFAALDWVAATLHAEGDAGDALRERLGLLREGGGRLLQTKDSGSWTHRRLVSLWEPLL